MNALCDTLISVVHYLTGKILSSIVYYKRKEVTEKKIPATYE